MAADIAALRAALLAAQLQAASPAPAAPAAPAARPSRAERRAAQARTAAALTAQDQGALAGSVLSPTTWKQAFRAVNRRAS
jgi:hypothetical protein